MTTRPVGLRDAHLHLAEHGENLGAIHLESCADLAACLDRITRAASESHAGWIIARGARINQWPERRFPTARELDDAGAGKPVMVASFDFHSASVSTAALRAAGITRGTPDPANGIIHRDTAGNPTGVLLEAAYHMIVNALPEPTDDQYADRIRRAQRDLVARGFVEVHDMLASARLAAALDALDRAGELELSVTLYAVPDRFADLCAWFTRHAPSERIRFGGMKLFTDGTLNSRTAAMLHPYTDPIAGHPRGTLRYTPTQLDGFFRRAAVERFEIATHAIGDAAVRAVLDAYDRVPARDRCGLRIEHAEFIDEADAPRFARLGVVASIQPCHLLTDIEAIQRFQPARAHRAFPIRELVDLACTSGHDPRELIRFGSDAPIVPPDPTDNIQAATKRTRAAGCGTSASVIAPDQAIDETLAWDLMRADPITRQHRESARAGNPAPRTA